MVTQDKIRKKIEKNPTAKYETNFDYLSAGFHFLLLLINPIDILTIVFNTKYSILILIMMLVY